MKKFLVAATFAALTITTSTTVSAKANLEDHGLEIRKRNRELIIREKKKQKLLSMVELSMMIFVLLLIPVLGTVIVREAVYLWLYIITGPVAAYLINQLRKMQEEV